MESKIVKLKKERNEFVDKYVDKIIGAIINKVTKENSKGKTETVFSFYDYDNITTEYKKEIIKRLKCENIYSYIQSDGKLYLCWKHISYKENKKYCLYNKYNWLLPLFIIVFLVAIIGSMVGFLTLFKFVGGIVGSVVLLFFVLVILS